MLTLDLEPVKPATGGNGRLPPTIPPLPFKRPDGANNGSNPAPQNNQPPVIPARHVAPSYPKPKAWVEKRIALCESHHQRFIAWRKANTAKLQAWSAANSPFDSREIAAQRYSAKLRAAVQARQSRG